MKEQKIENDIDYLIINSESFLLHMAWKMIKESKFASNIAITQSLIHKIADVIKQKLSKDNVTHYPITLLNADAKNIQNYVDDLLNSMDSIDQISEITAEVTNTQESERYSDTDENLIDRSKKYKNKSTVYQNSEEARTAPSSPTKSDGSGYFTASKINTQDSTNVGQGSAKPDFSNANKLYDTDIPLLRWLQLALDRLELNCNNHNSEELKHLLQVYKLVLNNQEIALANKILEHINEYRIEDRGLNKFATPNNSVTDIAINMNELEIKIPQSHTHPLFDSPLHENITATQNYNSYIENSINRDTISGLLPSSNNIVF